MERGKIPTITPSNILDIGFVLMFAKGAILIILAFYAIFAFMVIRQIDLMGKTLIAPVFPILKAFSILHTGFAVGLIVLAWGLL